MSTAKEMIEMLRAHYIAPSKPASGYFCPELSSPEGNRRADLIWLPLTHTQRGEIIGHEVKVSRADVIQELADPTKADAWIRHCTQWWLVVADPKLIDGLTIPEHWGVLAPPSGRRTRTMTVLKEAPKLRPVDQAMALAAILSRLFYSGDDAQSRIKFLDAQLSRMQDDKERAEQGRRLAEEQLHEVKTSPRDAEQIKSVLTELRNLQRGHTNRFRYLNVEPATIAAAAADYTVLRQRSQMLANRIRERIRHFNQALDKTDVTDIVDGLTAIERAIAADLEPTLEVSA
ncbi:MAG: hypothetical protein JWP32_2868 [Schumannella sp.]|nr:hypothetical protein [Schumannella sp.]